MKEINTIEMFNDVVKQDKSIVLFTGNWCPDCMVIKPFMPTIVEKYSDYQFYSVNRDHLMDVFVENDVFGIPSFVAYDQGEEIGRFVSKDRKTRQEIENFIESLN